ncbi:MULTISPECIES: nitrite reductase large subunit NirB [Psychrobacter]|jgi:nitrite reductase (NADH) large subunit|uniref:nitrite reductase large subunit NirB n=1 Tax=Psychrobacter TaxID=497 RepID=UPI00086890DF|nr:MULTISPECIES: nitrite reductase large subunit NirB [Psychrobacter]MBA6245183.1 nitrite reductase large subunit [Psychrobacter sp. Urea-trap-18]MBA6285584.1 nitrite reductase large subunit [Psychrobacter sp. Urea-trap-16]MBA6318831.1 nitrite reductase large subunit [Psychrobacter sp. Urea-trap-20]MBA6334028.1 nitrite reductase large subunit [Psychrobacter sp. Urea-trap-19]OEH68815.1 MAG: nitrite reductase large subunit [Psychrobacter sp. B29-1]|tara:strand:- start:1393 stop:3993 length:2601 start_codon:yes stop_codon:yes gene_type:complete
MISTALNTENKGNLVVIGNGMVGHHFIERAIEQGLHQQFDIHVFAEEDRPAYDRVYLSSYFEHKDASKLNLVDLTAYELSKVNLHLNQCIVDIDSASQRITTEAGEIIEYSELVLATGSYPFVPPIPGREHPHCHVYRTIADLDEILAIAELPTVKKGVVVGGGLLGLEAAKALVTLGLDTYVVEFAPQLMGVQLDAAGGEILKRKIEALGVKVLTGKNTKEILSNTARHSDDTSSDGQHLTMQFTDGTSLTTDMIVFSAGIRPQDGLIKNNPECGIEMGGRGGILINEQCRTNVDHVYAVGECAVWDNKVFGLVAPGYNMASICAAQIAGDSKQIFTGADMSTKLKLMGVDVGSIGDAHGSSEGSLSYLYQNPAEGIYKKLVTTPDNKRLLGAVLVGDTEDYNNLLQLYLNDIDLPAHPESLILPNVEKPVMGIDNLPDTATICSCYNVTKGAICSAVENGAYSVSDVKTMTSAGSGCGGCAPMVKDTVSYQLTAMGFEVNNDLCEHFAYSRQDLYSLIRVHGIKTFDELLTEHGSGHGCEICKPTVASILASCWNDYVLKTELTPLQDSNDYYLGNIQKDGTYSVVPRVPGGEITADKLIVLGQVAKQFNLYTKITGGMRVDLFGARMEQLPDIWTQLVQAGFETGHAYGKSLRTVKSCIGNNWCRYGVDDSIGLALRLEDRYKGVRSPHKIKMGVSGCMRECAEAQSKDFGMIATENGWNLFVCGNGGITPRHGELFATDLDTETMVKYIDRIIMFYIKTADKLQRTSKWRESLDGGLDYLKAVIIEDSLGIADELEAQMQLLVDNYVCEWAATINDTEKLKRFRHFVNSEKGDDNVVFVTDREQIRPATDAEKATINLVELA